MLGAGAEAKGWKLPSRLSSSTNPAIDLNLHGQVEVPNLFA